MRQPKAVGGTDGAMSGGLTRRRSYSEELELLAATFMQFRSLRIDNLDRWVNAARGLPAIFVASGGALAAARFGADLHEHVTGRLSKAVTPLEFSGMRVQSDTAVLMLSASGRHPDAWMAARVAVANGYDIPALLTFRRASDLPEPLKRIDLDVISLPFIPGREGFLATSSVLALATVLARTYLPVSTALPEMLDLLKQRLEIVLGPKCVALVGPGHACAGFDLETRMSELGISQVQVTDYRNFAHGRHSGFNRNLKSTSVVAFIAEPFRELADLTLEEFPSSCEIVRVETAMDWPASALDLLVGSMQIAGSTAIASGIEPARPRVPEFGRRLYHLKAHLPEMSKAIWPVQRKIVACAGALANEDLQAAYSAALREWFEKSVKEVAIGGIVLDYDGTCCATERRYDLPLEEVREELIRLLNEGCALAFASGRGKSLHRDLRRWLPKEHWDQVILGLYNGGVILRLGEDVPDQSKCEGELAQAADRVLASHLASGLRVERRSCQVSIEGSSTVWKGGQALAAAVAEILWRAPRLQLNIVASGHSVDIVPPSSSKTAVVDVMRGHVRRSVAAIGDQGQIGGNDFELLASTTLSLTVDRCSADPTRCWNLDALGTSGPKVLMNYLRSFGLSGGDLLFRWDVVSGI